MTDQKLPQLNNKRDVLMSDLQRCRFVDRLSFEKLDSLFAPDFYNAMLTCLQAENVFVVEC